MASFRRGFVTRERSLAAVPDDNAHGRTVQWRQERRQLRGDDYYETTQSLLSTLSFFILFIVTLVVCSLLNCWIETRRDERRRLALEKNRRSKEWRNCAYCYVVSLLSAVGTLLVFGVAPKIISRGVDLRNTSAIYDLASNADFCCACAHEYFACH